ncbi:hypothetical protein Pelo_5419 [Pelomyxa schiedti]|nr:hypothetical protein Pelo_5419 [Pelomyxa schiedti]
MASAPPPPPPLPGPKAHSRGPMPTLSYAGQQSLALLLSLHPRCGGASEGGGPPAVLLRRVPPAVLASVCRLLVAGRPSAVEVEARRRYDVEVGREAWHFAANEPAPGNHPMLGSGDHKLVYVWRDDRRVALSISPASNGVWKLWQGPAKWVQVWPRSNQKAVDNLIIPEQAAVLPMFDHTVINNCGEALHHKDILQFEKLPQGLLIRFLGGCNNGEILIPVSNNPTIVFTTDKTFSTTTSSRCPISILKH